MFLTLTETIGFSSMTRRDIKANGQIEIFPGCRHNLNDCEHVFNNQANFGGQPFIPSENPIQLLNGFF